MQNFLKTPFNYLKFFLKWSIIAIIVGTFGGVIGSIFHISIDLATEYRTENSYIIYFLPIGGLIITFLYKIFKKSGKLDTNRVFDAVKTENDVPFVMAPLIFISTVITHLLGGSAGREGAALQLGGSIGNTIGKVIKLNKDDKHIIVMSGMSAVFSALFGTPLTAIIFAIEVTAVGVMHTAALIPCAVSAITSFLIAGYFKLHPVRFLDLPAVELDITLLIKVMILGIMFALVSMLFCASIKKCEHIMEKHIKNSYARTFLGAVIIVVMTLVLNTYDYNGAGMDVITKAINGEAKYEAFILKILFTAITISAGFKGGEIVPAFFIGSTFGCVAGPLLGIEPGFAAALGFVGVFCGVVNCPIASIFLAVEVFNGNAMLYFVLICAISYIMSGYSSLYSSQNIVFSKTEDKLIDRKTY